MNNRYLIFNKEEWRMYRGANMGFDFTDEELDKAEKHPKNLIGTRNGVDCYLAILVPVAPNPPF